MRVLHGVYVGIGFLIQHVLCVFGVYVRIVSLQFHISYFYQIYLVYFYITLIPTLCVLLIDAHSFKKPISYEVLVYPSLAVGPKKFVQ